MDHTKEIFSKKTITVYRFENQKSELGIWRKFDGTVSPIFSSLTEGKCKDMPMDDSDFYRYEGKRWFAATDNKQLMPHWFSALDAIELEKLGYCMYEHEVTQIRRVSPYEVVFAKEDSVSSWQIDLSTIWGDEYVELKKNKEKNHG